MSKDKELIKLQKEWYNKLKEEGFKDTEYFDKNMTPKDMMRNEAHKFAQENVESFQSKEQYYIEASQFFHDHEFASELAKEIWYRHSEGDTFRHISTTLKVPYYKVQGIIVKHRNIMLKSRNVFQIGI